MSTISQSQIYIGYEEREHKAYEVCESSIKRRSNIDIVKLRSQDIPEYNRDWGEPQSTDFTFTRFWVPYLSDYKGWSFFVDCDFVFLADPLEILENVDPSKAVYVVKHPGYIPNSQIKMDGIAQHRAYRKNWASFTLFNNEHPKNSTLTPHYLNNYRPGIDFHQFRWLDDEDDPYYFEIRIQVDEITKDVSLMITDYAEEDEVEEAKMLWTNQISDLKQVLGSA